MTEAFTVVQAPDFAGVDWSADIVLKSTDDVYYVVKKDAARVMSDFLKTVIENSMDEKNIVTVEEANGQTLKYIVMYINHRYSNRKTLVKKPLVGTVDDLIDDWDKAFLYTDLIQGKDERKHDLLIRVLNASHFLQVTDLLLLGGCALATIIKGKTTEQLRDVFGLVDDFTDEERAELDGRDEPATGAAAPPKK